uniref:Uncharacterized protein n=1 Tax=Parascaris equorum TaxID=6256 RepID=A0A914RFR6_PAREQ
MCQMRSSQSRCVYALKVAKVVRKLGSRAKNFTTSKMRIMLMDNC